MSVEPLLVAESISKNFRVSRRTLRAVQRVSFSLQAGETLGLVGESGSGKSTLGRLCLRLLEADEGSVRVGGQDLAKLSPKALREKRKEMQFVFQDPMASLNPRMTVGKAVSDALRIHGIGTKQERLNRVEELFTRVGLSPEIMDVFPFELSGGQQQRVGIARALALRPKLIVCDEPISALDVSIQVQIIELLRDLQKEMNLGYIFISHNLGVVQYLSDYVMVLYLGEVVEYASADDLFEHPSHPYTKVLIESILSVPSSDARRRELIAIPGEVPSPLSPPSGCPFHPRCKEATDHCRQEKPLLREIASRHQVSCHLYA